MIVLTQVINFKFYRIGYDLRYIKRLTYPEAILGVDIEVPTIEGGKIKVNVPEFSNEDTILRLRGKGMSIINGKQRGDMLVKIEIDYPDKISDEERELLEKIKIIHQKREKEE